MQIPLINNEFLIDNSTLEHWQACPRLYQLSDIRLRTPAAGRAGRNFGSCIHAGLKARYTLCGSDAVLTPEVEYINSAMADYLKRNPQPEDDFRNYDHAVKVMEAYNAFYGNEPFTLINLNGKRMVEVSFAIPLGTVLGHTVRYCGRADLPISNNEGIWSLDHKTTFQFGTGFDDQMDQDGGQRGYAWMLKTVGGGVGEVVGYMINAIRIRRPGKTEGAVAPIDETDFLRIPKHLTNDDIEEWREDTLHLIENIFNAYQSDHFPRHRRSCIGKYGRCDMYDVCSLPRSSREFALGSNLFQDNTWTPLNETKQNERETK